MNITQMAYKMPGPPPTPQALEAASALLSAAYEKDLDEVDRLLKMGADPLLNVTGQAAGSPIDTAMLRSLEILERMIADPAVLHARDVSGATLMHRAAATATHPVILTLAQAGLGVNDRDHEGMTPLMRSIQTTGSGVTTLTPKPGVRVMTGSGVTTQTPKPGVRVIFSNGPGTARNVRALLALGAHIGQACPSICSNPISREDIEAAFEDPRPLINAVHIMSRGLTMHVMETRLDDIDANEIAQAHAYIKDKAEQLHMLAPDVAALFDSFLPALQVKRAIESIAKISALSQPKAQAGGGL